MVADPATEAYATHARGTQPDYWLAQGTLKVDLTRLLTCRMACSCGTLAAR